MTIVASPIIFCLKGYFLKVYFPIWVIKSSNLSVDIVRYFSQYVTDHCQIILALFAAYVNQGGVRIDEGSEVSINPAVRFFFIRRIAPHYLRLTDVADLTAIFSLSVSRGMFDFGYIHSRNGWRYFQWGKDGKLNFELSPRLILRRFLLSATGRWLAVIIRKRKIYFCYIFHNFRTDIDKL